MAVDEKLLREIVRRVAAELDDANWLSPYGAEIRYPGDRSETVAGDQIRAQQLAQKVRNAVIATLGPYLSGQ